MSNQIYQLPKDYRQQKTAIQKQQAKLNACLLIPEGMTVKVSFQNDQEDEPLYIPQQLKINNKQ